jgi:hypothetical protein
MSLFVGSTTRKAETTPKRHRWLLIGGVKIWRADHGLLRRNVTRKKPGSRNKKIRRLGGSKRKRARPVQDRRSAIKVWILPAHDPAHSLSQSSGIISALLNNLCDEKA